PRIGLAFRPSEKWVLRAGAGWFDNIEHLNNWTILNLMPPKSGSLVSQAVTDAFSTIPITNADGSTTNAVTRIFRAGSPILTLDDPFQSKTPPPTAVLMAPPDTKDGDVWKWNFDIQRELPHSIAWTIGYVGNKGTHTGNSIGNFNDARPSPNTDVQSRRPYQQYYDPALPQFGVQTVSTIRYLDSYGNSFYHAMQAKIDKRFQRGLSLGAAYTFSKANGDGEAGGNEGVAFQDPRNRKASKGLFRFDQTHVLVAHYVSELPGANMKGPLRYLIGGWQSNGILSLRSGFPITLSEGTGDLNIGSGPARPDRIADGRLDNRSRALLYDPTAIQRATCNIP